MKRRVGTRCQVCTCYLLVSILQVKIEKPFWEIERKFYFGLVVFCPAEVHQTPGLFFSLILKIFSERPKSQSHSPFHPWNGWIEGYVKTIPKLLELCVFLVTPANGAKIVSRNLKIATHLWHTCESHLLRVCCTLVYIYSSSHFTGWVDSGWDLSTANPFHHQPDFSKNDFDDDHHYQSSWLISSLPFDKRRPASQFTPFQTRPALQSPAWEAGGDGGGWSGWSWGWGGWSIIIDHVNFNNDLRWAGQKILTWIRHL